MALLSLLVTGLGSMLTGHVGRGLCFLAAVIGGAGVGLVAILLTVPVISDASDTGAALATAVALLPLVAIIGVHLWGVVDAYRTAVAHNRELGVS